MAAVGHGDGDGVDLVEQVSVIVESHDVWQDSATARALLGSGVGHADEFDVGHPGEDPGVMAAQVSDSDDADFEPGS